MSEYSIAEAKNQLPRLIDRMLRGEAVIITRRGKAIARVAPLESPETQAPSQVDLDWLRELRRSTSTGVDPTIDTVREMRDAYRY